MSTPASSISPITRSLHSPSPLLPPTAAVTSTLSLDRRLTPFASASSLPPPDPLPPTPPRLHLSLSLPLFPDLLSSDRRPISAELPLFIRHPQPVPSSPQPATTTLTSTYSRPRPLFLRLPLSDLRSLPSPPGALSPRGLFIPARPRRPLTAPPPASLSLSLPRSLSLFLYLCILLLPLLAAATAATAPNFSTHQQPLTSHLHPDPFLHLHHQSIIPAYLLPTISFSSITSPTSTSFPSPNSRYPPFSSPRVLSLPAGFLSPLGLPISSPYHLSLEPMQ